MISKKLMILVLCIFVGFYSQSNAQEKKKDGDIFYEVDEMPEYPGGELALRKDIAGNVKYPEKAKNQRISGKVYVSFVVNKKGKVVEPTIARGVNPLLDKEALRVIGELKTWKPGKEDGKPVKVQYTVPIKFALNSKKSSKKNGDVYYTVDVMPVYPGGDSALRSFIAKNVKYPSKAKEAGIQGKVYISFVVDKDGSVTDAKVARGVDPLLDKESVRVVESMQTWNPGMEDGEPVKVQYTVPINFALGTNPKPE
jgi:TonB family protein